MTPEQIRETIAAQPDTERIAAALSECRGELRVLLIQMLLAGATEHQIEPLFEAFRLITLREERPCYPRIEASAAYMNPTFEAMEAIASKTAHEAVNEAIARLNLGHS